MRILLTGSSGQVGWELQRSLAPLGEVIPLHRRSSPPLDLADAATLEPAIQAVQPQLIVNPAAYTAVDRAEAEPELAMAVNGTAPGVLAAAAHRRQIPLIHYSTEYVFDGLQATPYRETDPTHPQNVYGHSKRAGEAAIQTVGGRHMILRTSWVYGLRGRNFLLTMLRLAQEREELRVVNDQIGAPTWSRLIAAATAQIVAQGLGDLNDFFQAHGGLYHLTAAGQTSWYDFAQAIFELAPVRPQRLQPISTPEYPTPARRPASSLLDCQRVRRQFGLALPDWQQSLRLAMEA